MINQNEIIEGCTLIDAQAQHAAAPETITVPTAEEIATVAKGHSIKVGVQFPETDTCTGERFYIEVTDRLPDGRIVGTVNSPLIYSDVHGIAYADTLTVEPRHVMDIQKVQRDHIFRRDGAWFCSVGGREFGSWRTMAEATAGLYVELSRYQRRLAEQRKGREA